MDDAKSWIQSTTQLLQSHGMGPADYTVNGSDVNQQLSKNANPSVRAQISRVPGQIAGMAGKALGFIGHSIAAGPVGIYNQVTGHDFDSIEAQTNTALAKAQQLDSDFKAGKLTRDQYVQALNANGKDLKAAHDAAHDYTKNFTKNLALHEAETAGDVLTAAAPAAEAGAGAIAAGASAKAGQMAAIRALAAGEATPEATQAAIEALNGASKVGKAADATAGVVDATVGAGKTLGNNPVTATAGKAVRNALVTQPTAEIPFQIGDDLSNHRYKQAAINAGILIGAPLAAGVLAPKVASVAAAGVKKLFGNKSFLDEIPTADQKITDYLKSGNATEEEKNTAKVMQQYNLNQSGGDVHNAVQFYKTWLGADAANMTAKEHLQDFQKMVDEVNQYRTMAMKGELPKPGGGQWTPDEIKNIWVGRFSTTDRTQIVNELDGLNNAERAARIDELSKVSPWGQNDHLVNQLREAAANDNYRGEIAKLNPTVDLRDVPAGTYAVDASRVDENSPEYQAFREATGGHDLPQAAPRDNGIRQDANKYVPILRQSGEDIPKASESGPIVEGTPGTAFGRKIEDFGLSPQATPKGAVVSAVKENLGAELEGTSLEGQQGKVWRALVKEMDAHGGVYDPRMLTTQQVLNALGTTASRSDAEMVSKALRQAYSDVPSRLVGGGDAAVNNLINSAPLMSQYLKLQGIAKFSANPFFYLKQLTKSGLVALAEGADHFGMSEDTERFLRSEGYFSKYTRDAGVSDFLGTSIGNTAGQAQLSKLQQNMIGGLAESLAKARGFDSVEAALKDPEVGSEIDHALRVTVSYPKGGYIQSPLAKTLNVLIFPSRFETKVATVAAKWFARQPVGVQVAAVTDLANFTSFLKSPEGQKWQKDNAETLNLVKYFTPLSTLDNINKFLNGGHHVADLGEIGGLPFGVISQLLQHQGLDLGTLSSSAYRDPKTGDIVPEKIPVSLKGRAQQLVTDIIESTFSWPGKQAGLNLSKKDIATSLPGLQQNPKDFKTVTPDGSNPPATEGQTQGNETGQPMNDLVNPPTGTFTPEPKATTSTPKAKRVVPADKLIRP